MERADTQLVALDWGTSQLRAYRLGGGGAALEARELARGIAYIARGAESGEERARDFERAFAEACADWLRACPGVPVIACGMVGSAQGWREAGYLDVPASFDDLGSALVALETDGGIAVHIVPGVRENGRLPNVMRGEETQIAGALADPAWRAPPGRTTLVGLPGTHSKWAQIRDRQIIHFDTFMTGEVYELLSTHSLLARTLVRSGDANLAAFDRGLRAAGSPEGRAGVLATIFSTRALGLAGALSAEAQADYLSGLLIGHEIQGLVAAAADALDGADRILLVGDEGLCRRYRRALARFGYRDVAAVHDAAPRGLWRVADSAGLVSGRDEARWKAPGSKAPGRTGLRQAVADTGLVAILRGMAPDEAAAVGGALYAAGVRAVEVPLNSPDPLASIRILRRALAPDCAVGAGTAMKPADIDDVCRAGGEFAVMPHSDASLIRACRAAGLEVMPGVATISEAIAALDAGADVLKMFPAEQLGAGTLAAWRAVLPAGTLVVPVGGVTTSNLAAFVAAGAVGVGLGSALYRPGRPADQVGAAARDVVAAWRAATARL